MFDSQTVHGSVLEIEIYETRVRAGLLRIATAHPDELVAVVVHGGVIGAALAVATGSPAFAFHGAENGSISRLVIQEDNMILRGFNGVSHLPVNPS